MCVGGRGGPRARRKAGTGGKKLRGEGLRERLLLHIGDKFVQLFVPWPFRVLLETPAPTPGFLSPLPVGKKTEAQVLQS